MFLRKSKIAKTLLVLLVSTSLYAVDTYSNYVWNKKIGWIDFNKSPNQTNIYIDHLEGYLWNEKIGWIELGVIHTNQLTHTYENTNLNNWGVNINSKGKLLGYAWNEKIGWIEFNTNGSEVSVDLETGIFTGYAWNKKIGWIEFSNNTNTLKLLDNINIQQNNENTTTNTVDETNSANENQNDNSNLETNQSNNSITYNFPSSFNSSNRTNSDGSTSKIINDISSQNGNNLDLDFKTNLDGSIKSDIEITTPEGKTITLTVEFKLSGSSVDVDDDGSSTIKAQITNQLGQNLENSILTNSDGSTNAVITITNADGSKSSSKVDMKVVGATTNVLEDGTTTSTSPKITLSSGKKVFTTISISPLGLISPTFTIEEQDNTNKSTMPTFPKGSQLVVETSDDGSVIIKVIPSKSFTSLEF